MKKFNEIKDENDKYIKAENAEREKKEAKDWLFIYWITTSNN